MKYTCVWSDEWSSFLSAIINSMNEGISFEEACKLSPEGLTAEQLQDCPGQEVDMLPYVFMVLFVIAVALLGIIVFRMIKSKRP